MNSSQARSTLQLLEQLASATQGRDLAKVRVLSEQIRAVSLDLADWINQTQGTVAQRGLLRRLFKVGVFDSPPISGAAYSAWQRLQDRNVPPLSPAAPALSILIPIYKPNLTWLAEAVQSVLRQPYPKLELCLADDNSEDPALRQYLEQLCATDFQVKCVFRAQNGHISVATNSALELASGDWCVLLDQDDLLAENSLLQLGAYLAGLPSQVKAVFSDEDKVDAEGTGELFSPLFKPGFDPDLLLACNCVSHLGAYKTAALRRLGGLRPGYEGVQDHDLCLRMLTEYGPEAFRHLPLLLYHWRQHQGSTATHQDRKPYVQANGWKMRENYKQTQRENKQTQSEILFASRPDSGFSAVSFQPPEPRPSVNVLVLADSDFAGLPDHEQSKWFDRLNHLLAAYGPAFSVVLELDEHTDWAGLINAAVRQSSADALILLRAGDLALSDNWCSQLVGAICREGVGVAGCRTINERNFIIQAGYAVSRSPLPLAVATEQADELWLCPAYAGLSLESPGYFGFAHLLHSVLSVDLSGLCCKRQIFLDAGGLDQALGSLAAVDFCLRLWRKQKLRSLILPGADLRSQAAAGFLPVQGEFARRWGDLLQHNPPWQSPHLDWTSGGWRLMHPRKTRLIDQEPGSVL